MTKTNMIVLGDAPLVTGFRLAGLEHSLLIKDADFQKELESILDKKEFGVIIVNEKMLGKIDWRLKKKLDLIAFPVIVPIPDIHERSLEGDQIRNLIKRALGFDLSNKK